MNSTIKSDFRNKQYKRLKASRYIASNYTGHAVQGCNKSVKSASIKIKKNAEGRAYFSGLYKCHSVWDCPHCSAIIAKGRSEEIKKSLDDWRLQGGKVKLVTYTVRHNKGDSLKDLQYAVNEAYRFSKSGAPYQRLKESYKILGSIVANEVTYSEVFGWHYHRHEIVYYKNDKEFQEFETVIFKRYYARLLDLGFSALPDIGVYVSDGEGSLSNYLSKWGLENEVTSNKEAYSRTPFQLLDDEESYNLFIEYSKVMLGKRRITWSRGLKAYFSINEIQDQDMVDQEDNEEDEVILAMSTLEWKYILNHNLYVIVLEEAEQNQASFSTWFYNNISIYI